MAQLKKPSVMSMLKTVLLTSLMVTLPILGVRFFGGFERLELGAYDQFLRWRSPEGADDRIVVVTIDDDDIETLQEYPIHDGTLAKALDKLVSYEPRGIGLDISRDVPHGSPEGRQQLTRILKENPVIISGCLLSTENHPGSPPAPGSEEGTVAFADFPIDPDSSVRRTKLISTPAEVKKLKRTKHLCNDAQDDNEILSLSFQLALLYLEDLQVDPQPTDSGEIELSQTILKRIHSRFGGYANADANDYQLMLNYRGGQQPFRQIPITQVLDNQIDPRSIRDRIVLVGYTSEVSKDFLKTPYIQSQTGSQDMFGVLVHAHAVSQILSAVVNQRLLIQSWNGSAQVMWILGMALGSGLIAFYTRRLSLFFLGLVGVGVAVWGIGYGLFIYQGLWIPVVPTLVAAMLTAIGVRAADLGSRSGYAQAIYEQLRDQFLNNAVQRDRKGDYLESLVQRARAARQGQDAALSSPPALDPQQITEAPDMQALYEQVAAQVRQEMAAEQARHQSNAGQPQDNRQKRDRIQMVLNRAQQSRQQPPVNPATQMSDQPLPEEPHD